MQLTSSQGLILLVYTSDVCISTSIVEAEICLDHRHRLLLPSARALHKQTSMYIHIHVQFISHCSQQPCCRHRRRVFHLLLLPSSPVVVHWQPNNRWREFHDSRPPTTFPNNKNLPPIVRHARFKRTRLFCSYLFDIFARLLQLRAITSIQEEGKGICRSSRQRQACYRAIEQFRRSLMRIAVGVA